MTAKEYLRQAFTAHNRIAALQEQAKKHREDMTRINQSRTQETVQSSRKLDPMGDLVVRKLTKIEECYAGIANFGTVLMCIEDAINRIGDAGHDKYQTVLRLRYIENIVPNEIAKTMWQSRSWVYDKILKGENLLDELNAKDNFF